MNELYDELSRKALAHNFLYHYTSISTLKVILKNKSLRLSRLDLVNDPEENKRITSLWNTKVYVACFTNTLESSKYFFENYGKVRITFKNALVKRDVYFDSQLTNKLSDFCLDYNSKSDLKRKTYSEPQDWCLFDVSFADVFYTDDLSMHIANDGHEYNAGLIKSRRGVDWKGIKQDWSVEKESRLRVAVRPIGMEFIRKGISFDYPKPPFEYLYISTDSIITNIELCDNCSQEERMIFNQIITSKF